MKRHLLRLAVPLKEPFATAGGVVAERELVVIRLEDDDGVVGFGEAAPLEPYDGVSVTDVVEALQEGPPRRGGPPQARTAWELAELDLQGRRRGRALAEAMADAIPVNCTLPAGPPDEVAAAASAGVRAGYSCFKVKVGLPDDVERVAAVREAIGSWPALRLDANGTWGAEQAVEEVKRLEPYDLELVEQPCSTLEDMARVRARVEAPIAADEPIQGPEDVARALQLEACDAVNVKLAGSGGFLPARATLRAAREAGMGAWLSSTLDGPWAIGAALQLASSEGVTLACGLATLELFDARIARVLPAPANGLMCVPDGPGIGVDVDAEALAEVLVEEVHR